MTRGVLVRDVPSYAVKTLIGKVEISALSWGYRLSREPVCIFDRLGATSCAVEITLEGEGAEEFKRIVIDLRTQGIEAEVRP